MALSSGTHLRHYDVRSKLGKGGMGEVYRARDTKLGREVAIKVLSAAFSEDSDRLRRFEQEAQGLAAAPEKRAEAITTGSTWRRSAWGQLKVPDQR
jgi:serine/threonine protein kinase